MTYVTVWTFHGDPLNCTVHGDLCDSLKWTVDGDPLNWTVHGDLCDSLDISR